MGTAFSDKARILTEFATDDEFADYEDRFSDYLDEYAAGLGLAEAYTYAGMRELSPDNTDLVEDAWDALCTLMGLDPNDTYYEAVDLNPGNL